MILTTHTLAGAVIGKYASSPLAIVGVSLALHFVMDHLRHGEYLNRKSTFRDTTWKVALDLASGLGIVGLIIFFRNDSSVSLGRVTLGVFTSMFPDLLTVLYWKLHLKPLGIIHRFHTFVHKYPPFSEEREWNLRNSFNDIFISLIAILLLLW